MDNAADVLAERRCIWPAKPILKKLYGKWYRRIGAFIVSGHTLELGGGSGNLKDFFPRVTSTDIVYAPWLDAVSDAICLPFRSASIGNIILFDVLHHLERPLKFLQEAQRVLDRRGRLIMMEPFVSVASAGIYRFLHHEGIDWKWNPFLSTSTSGTTKHPFEGNQAVANILFYRHRTRILRQLTQMYLIFEERTDFFAYPLSGGFHKPSLCPVWLYPVLTRLEKALKPLNRLLAFRVLLVLEKRPK